METLGGIDEAGRGAVIGPLVIAGVTINKKDIIKLTELNIKDSKMLTKNQRENLFPKILSIATSYRIEIIHPQEIDNAVMGNNSLNLNKLEANYTAKIINLLNPDEVIIDCPSNNILTYKEYFIRFIEKREIKILLEHKADINYPIVSSASIIAKVTRDDEIEKIKKKINIDFGSGYPSDPLTKEFLKGNITKHPDIFRKSWSTVRRINKTKSEINLYSFK